MSVVAKRSPISATAELLLLYTVDLGRVKSPLRHWQAVYVGDVGELVRDALSTWREVSCSGR